MKNTKPAGKSASRRPRTIDLQASEAPRKAEKAVEADVASAPESAAPPPSESPPPQAKAEPAAENKTAAFGRPDEAAPRDDAAQPSQRAGASPMQLLFAGFAGGLAALALLAGLAMTGLAPALFSNNRVERSELEALQQQQQAAHMRFQERADGLENGLSGLRAEISRLEAAFGDGAQIQQRVTELATSFDAMEAQLQEMREQFSAAGLENARELADTLGTRITEAEARLTDLNEQAAAISAPASDELEELRQSTARMNEQLNELQQRLPKMEEELAALKNQIEEGLAQTEQSARELARRFAASALASAHARDESLSSLLDSLQGLDLAPDRVEALRALTASAPSIAVLRREFDNSVAQEIIAAGQTSLAEPQGALARLMNNARSLVRVRPAAPLEGDEPEAIVSRISAALAAGQGERARQEWEKLPEAGRQASADWADRLARRIEADRQIAELVTELSGGADTGR